MERDYHSDYGHEMGDVPAVEFTEDDCTVEFELGLTRNPAGMRRLLADLRSPETLLDVASLHFERRLIDRIIDGGGQ